MEALGWLRGHLRGKVQHFQPLDRSLQDLIAKEIRSKSIMLLPQEHLLTGCPRALPTELPSLLILPVVPVFTSPLNLRQSFYSRLANRFHLLCQL